MSPDKHPGIGARIRAARHLADIRQVSDLSAEINQKGLGTTKLRQMEREEIPSEARDLEAIAHACKLPVEWFTADFSRLPEISPPDSRKILAQQTAAASQRGQERRAGKPASPPARRKADQ